MTFSSYLRDTAGKAPVRAASSAASGPRREAAARPAAAAWCADPGPACGPAANADQRRRRAAAVSPRDGDAWAVRQAAGFRAGVAYGAGAVAVGAAAVAGGAGVRNAGVVRVRGPAAGRGASVAGMAAAGGLWALPRVALQVAVPFG